MLQVLAHFYLMPLDPEHTKPMVQRFVPNAWDWSVHKRAKGELMYVASTHKVSGRGAGARRTHGTRAFRLGEEAWLDPVMNVINGVVYVSGGAGSTQ